MSMLEIRRLSVSYANRRVLKDISFTVGGGELIGLIGPNGAGKSTLIKAILGLLPATGNIRISGRDARQLSVHERADVLSYLPQEREVAWPVSVETLVGLGRTSNPAKSLPPDHGERQIIEQAMQRTDIINLRKRPVDSLSGGERARVLMARALAQDTPIILADEPIAGLDPAHQIGFMEMLEELAHQGRTVIVSMHELPLAARWCHRLILLDDGVIIVDGEPRGVLNDHYLAKVYGVSAYVSENPDDFFVLPLSRIPHLDGLKS